MRPNEEKGILSAGNVVFKTERRRAKASARFAVVQDTVAVERLVHMFEKDWRLKRPSVLLSITGSAQDLRLDTALEQVVKHGLADAARSTNAWVFTGGTDAGVMSLTGLALRDVGAHVTEEDGKQKRTPCIGIAPWRKVTHREKLCANPTGDEADADRRMEVLYVKRKPNSRESAAIDPNHTHFLLVDNGKDEYGGEINLRGMLEHALAQRYRVPTVLLVVQGGPGTYATVRKGIEMGQRVILVKESRGAAQVWSPEAHTVSTICPTASSALCPLTH